MISQLFPEVSENEAKEAEKELIEIVDSAKQT